MAQTITDLGIARRTTTVSESDLMLARAAHVANFQLSFGELQTRLAAGFRTREAIAAARHTAQQQHAPQWVLSPLMRAYDNAIAAVEALLRKETRMLDEAERLGIDLDPRVVAV